MQTYFHLVAAPTFQSLLKNYLWKQTTNEYLCKLKHYSEYFRENLEWKITKPSSKIFRPTRIDGEKDTAIIVCSSGTTGLSKGDKNV